MIIQKQINFIKDLAFFSKVADILGVLALGIICYDLHLGGFTPPKEYQIAFVVTSLLTLNIFPQFDIYASWRGRKKTKRYFKIAYALGTVMLALVLLSFILKTTIFYSRIWFFTWTISSYLYLVFYRALIDMFLRNIRKRGINRKKVFIYGCGLVGQEINNNLIDNYEIGFDVIGFFDDSAERHNQTINGVKVFDPVELNDKIHMCDELWIALPLYADSKVKEILYKTRHRTAIIRYIPDIFNFRLLNQSITQIAGFPVINLNGEAMSESSKVIKRIEDVTLSILIFIFIFPVLFIIAILIKLTSKGPILYKQERHGWDGKTIKVYKFRSMYYEPGASFKQATRGDSRITKVGSFIRRTSLDELPQFYNVLQGRMSIVGPRPHPVTMNHDYMDRIENYMQRHKVKPGITGWAQINGFRGETDTFEKMEKRIEFDLYYIQHWSLFFDLKIIFLTVFKGFFGKNAY